MPALQASLEAPEEKVRAARALPELLQTAPSLGKGSLVIRRRCVWCREPLVHRPGQFWVHEATGRAYVTVFDADGRERDDHCALPDWSYSGAMESHA